METRGSVGIDKFHPQALGGAIGQSATETTELVAFLLPKWGAPAPILQNGEAPMEDVILGFMR